MNRDPEKEEKDRFLETLLNEHPGISPRLLAGVIRLPRAPFFRTSSQESLFGSNRPTGWGKRVSPSLKETILILNEAEIRPGEKVAIWQLTDLYFLLLLLELTTRVVIVEEEPEIRTAIHQSVDELGHAYIPVLSSLAELENISGTLSCLIRVAEPSALPEEGRVKGVLKTIFRSWALKTIPSGGRIEH
ncbi:MAG: hypothetical protein ACYCRD_03660 [Leptospirillum sp.]